MPVTEPRLGELGGDTCDPRQDCIQIAVTTGKSRGSTQAMLGLLLMLGGCDWNPANEKSLPVKEAVGPRLAKHDIDLTSLKAAAHSACECARQAGRLGDAGCWKTFNQRWKQLEDRNYPPGFLRLAKSGWACAPVSSSQQCMELTDGTVCVETDYELVGTEHFVCNPADAAALEALVNERMVHGSGEVDLEAAYSDFLSGKRSKEAAGGCAG